MVSIDSIDSAKCPVCGHEHELELGNWHALPAEERPAPRPAPPDTLRHVLALLRDPNYRDCLRAALVELLTEPVVDIVLAITEDGTDS